MEEKQYEMWFESCRFHDLVRWSKQGKVDLDAIFNKSPRWKSGKYEVPTLYDEYFIEGTPGYKKEHKLFTKYDIATCSKFVVGKNEYLPFPLDFKVANPNLQDVLGWAN